MTRKKHLLLIGGGYAEIPLVNAAKEMGWFVTTTGNNPGAPGHQLADRYEPCDFSDVTAVLSVAKSIDCDAVCSGSNDFAALSAAHVAEKMRLPGHDPLAVAKVVHEKHRFMAMANEIGLSVPRSYEVKDGNGAAEAADAIKGKVLIKPVDLTGGKGVQEIENEASLLAAVSELEKLSRQNKFLVQEFISGSGHAAFTFIIDGVVEVFLFDDEHYYADPYSVGAASFPSSVEERIQKKVLEDLQLLTDHLDLADGLLHAQFIVANGRHYLIDVCRRAPGDLYLDFATRATGLKVSQMILNGETGMAIERKGVGPSGNCLVRHCVVAESGGVNVSLSCDIEGGQLTTYYPLVETGKMIEDPLREKIGIALIEFSSKSKMRVFTEAPEKQLKPLVLAVGSECKT
jgi:biotin carboxylase